MCEGKFLVRTSISQNNIIQEVQVENYRCGLRIIKKAKGDWACQALDAEGNEAETFSGESATVPGPLVNSSSCSAVPSDTDQCLDLSIKKKRNPDPGDTKEEDTLPKKAPTSPPIGSTLRQLLSSSENKKATSSKRQLPLLFSSPLVASENTNQHRSTLLSLLQCDTVNSRKPFVQRPPPFLQPGRGVVKTESCVSRDSYVVHENSAITITKLPSVPTSGRVEEESNRYEGHKRQFRRTAPGQISFSASARNKEKPVQNKYLSHLLGPSPLLKLHLLNLFVVPLNGSKSFPDLVPVRNLARLKMLFDEDGSKESTESGKATGKKQDGEQKRRSDDSDEAVSESCKKIKIEADDDENNLIIDEQAEGSNSMDQDSDESYSNQNGNAEESEKGNEVNTGDNADDQGNSGTNSENQDVQPNNDDQITAGGTVSEQLKEKQQNSSESDTDASKNGLDDVPSKDASADACADAVSKLRSSLLDGCNSNAGNSIASSSSSCSENGDNTKVLQLEKEIMGLTSLLKAKEKEWNAILELKKLKELTIEYYRRQKDVEEMLEQEGIREHEEYLSKLKKLNDRMNYLNDKTGPDEAQVQTNIQKTEKETKEAERKLKATNIHGKSLGSKDETLGNDVSQLDNFKASLALQQLCERNKSSYTHATSPVQISAGSPGLSNKVIGEGRQGAIVEVRSIIADYRSKNPGDSRHGSPSSGGRRRSTTHKKSSASSPSANNLPNVVSQNPNISFKDVLVNLAKLSQGDKTVGTMSLNTEAAVVTPSVRSVTKINTSSGQVNSLNNRAQLSTTLAKLLSSNNSVTNLSGNMLKDDTPHVGSLKMNSLTHAGDSLSLANLLASAKCRDDEVKGDDEEMVPICQGCNANRAQFVCAGCSNQWYCCRECQIQAWEDHSEVCSG